jgi:hypothetical protein
LGFLRLLLTSLCLLKVKRRFVALTSNGETKTYMKASTCTIKIQWFSTEACTPTVLAGFLCLCILGSSLSMHVCHLRGVLLVYWVCRVFSGSED